MTPKTGEIWDITHSRKGSFTAKLISYHPDTCTLEIVEGRARLLQGGTYEQGETLDAKTSFINFHQRREDLEGQTHV